MRGRRTLLGLLLPLAAAALIALVAAGCGGGEDDDPRELLRTAAAKEIESADMDLRAEADVPGFPILGSQLAITGGGPIAANGDDALPTLDWRVALRAGGQTFPARVIAVDGRAYVEFQGLAYVADRKLLRQLGIDGGGGDGAGGDAMTLRRLGIDPNEWLTDLDVGDGDDIGGDSTRLITGEVDDRAVVEDLAALAESEDVRERVERSAGKRAAMLPDPSEIDVDAVADAVEVMRIEVNVDDEGYPRRVFGELRFEVPESVKDTAIEDGTVEFELVLEEIGVEVDPRPPANPRPLEDLLRFAGVIFGVEEPADLWRTPR